MLPEKDTHTEHCCARCGWCKYQDPDCTVVRGERVQSYPHLYTSVCYEQHPEYLKKESCFYGGASEAPDNESFPIFLASFLGVREGTSNETMLDIVKARLGLD